MTRRQITTSAAPAALGPYSQGINAEPFVFCSGQIGIDPFTGELAEGIEGQAERALRNLAAVLDAAGLTLNHVVKTTVFLVDIAEFPRMNDVYARFFSDPQPARSTIGVAALPGGARFEIEAIGVRDTMSAAVRNVGGTRT